MMRSALVVALGCASLCAACGGGPKTCGPDRWQVQAGTAVDAHESVSNGNLALQVAGLGVPTCEPMGAPGCPAQLFVFQDGLTGDFDLSVTLSHWQAVGNGINPFLSDVRVILIGAKGEYAMAGLGQQFDADVVANGIFTGSGNLTDNPPAVKFLQVPPRDPVVHAQRIGSSVRITISDKSGLELASTLNQQFPSVAKIGFQLRNRSIATSPTSTQLPSGIQISNFTVTGGSPVLNQPGSVTSDPFTCPDK